MASTFETLSENCRRRLSSARASADACRESHDAHRASMNAVFVLEDTLFALMEVAQAFRGAERSVARKPVQAD